MSRWACFTTTAFAQYEPALAEFERALELQPNYAAGAPIYRFCASPAGQMAYAALDDAEEIHRAGPAEIPYVPGGLAETYVISAHVERSARASPSMPSPSIRHDATAMRDVAPGDSLNRTGDAQESLQACWRPFRRNDLLVFRLPAIVCQRDWYRALYLCLRAAISTRP